MSEWEQLACASGQSDSYGFTGVYRRLHIVPELPHNSLYLEAPPGQTRRFHIYDDPAYFGNSRPTAVAAYLGRERRWPSQDLVFDWQGSVTLYLWTDESRTQGVWAKITERFSTQLWTRFPQLDENIFYISGMTSLGVENAFMLPIPSNTLVDSGDSGPDVASSFVASRFVSFGKVGESAAASYDLSFLKYTDVLLELAVVQFPDEPTATCIVGDYSQIGWHYTFDSGISFRPEGFVSPFTLASVEVSADSSPVSMTVAQWDRTKTIDVLGPRVAGADICRYSAGQFSDYHHDGHYPAEGAYRFARYGVDLFPMRKPRNGAVPSRSFNAAYGISSYTTQRSQFSIGNFSVPKVEATGHWTICPSSSNAAAGALQINSFVDEGASPPAGFFVSVTPDRLQQFIPQIDYPVLASLVPRSFFFGNTSPSGDTLAHNCAYVEHLDISEDTGVRQHYFQSAPFSVVQSTDNLVNQNPDITTPYVVPDVANVAGDITFPGGEEGLAFAQAFVEQYNIAISTGQYTFNYMRSSFQQRQFTVPVRVTWELHYVLRQVQGFAFMGYRRAGQAILPAQQITPDASISTSGNLDAWQKGLPAPIEAITQLNLKCIVNGVVDVEAQNVSEWVYPAQIVSNAPFQTIVRVGGTPQPGLLQGQKLFLFQSQDYLRFDRQFSSLEAAAIRSGQPVVVPGYVSSRVGFAHRTNFYPFSVLEHARSDFTAIGFVVQLA